MRNALRRSGLALASARCHAAFSAAGVPAADQSVEAEGRERPPICGRRATPAPLGVAHAPEQGSDVGKGADPRVCLVELPRGRHESSAS